MKKKKKKRKEWNGIKSIFVLFEGKIAIKMCKMQNYARKKNKAF